MNQKLSAEDVATVTTSAEKAIWKAIGYSKGSRNQANHVADLVQETFVKILINYDPERGKIGGLAYTTAFNLALDFTRGRACYGAEHKGVSSLTVTDESGADIAMDIADGSVSARDIMIQSERDENIANAVASLSDAHKRALEVALADDVALSGADRIAKMRAIDALQESVKSPGYVARAVAKRVKAKREPKIEAEVVEPPPQWGLSIVAKWNYVANRISKFENIVAYCPAPDLDMVG